MGRSKYRRTVSVPPSMAARIPILGSSTQCYHIGSMFDILTESPFATVLSPQFSRGVHNLPPGSFPSTSLSSGHSPLVLLNTDAHKQIWSAASALVEPIEVKSIKPSSPYLNTKHSCQVCTWPVQPELPISVYLRGRLREHTSSTAI